MSATTFVVGDWVRVVGNKYPTANDPEVGTETTIVEAVASLAGGQVYRLAGGEGWWMYGSDLVRIAPPVRAPLSDEVVAVVPESAGLSVDDDANNLVGARVRIVKSDRSMVKVGATSIVTEVWSDQVRLGPETGNSWVKFGEVERCPVAVRVTQDQLDMMRNATGGKSNGHRNRYITRTDIDNYPAWRELETMGLARSEVPHHTEDIVFRVTDAGLRLIYGYGWRTPAPVQNESEVKESEEWHDPEADEDPDEVGPFAGRG